MPLPSDGIGKGTALILDFGHDAVIGKAEGLLAVANDQVIQEADMHETADQVQGAGELLVLGRGFQAAGGMIVGNDQGGGISFEGGYDNLAGIHGVDRDRALVQHLGVNDPVGSVEVDNSKGLPFVAAQLMDQILGYIGGRGNIFLTGQSLPEITPGHALDEMEGEYILLTYPSDTGQTLGGCIQDCRERAQFLQGATGGILAILARRAETQEQLDELGVGKGIHTVLQKLIPQPLPVSGALILPLGLIHVQAFRTCLVIRPQRNE